MKWIIGQLLVFMLLSFGYRPSSEVIQSGGTGIQALNDNFTIVDMDNLVFESVTNTSMSITNGGIDISSMNNALFEVSFKICGAATSNQRSTAEHQLFLDGSPIDHTLVYSYHRTNQDTDEYGCATDKTFFYLEGTHRIELRSKRNTLTDQIEILKDLTKISIKKL